MKIKNLETDEVFEATGSVNVLHVVDEVEEVWIHYTYVQNDEITSTVEISPLVNGKFEVIY